MDAYIIYEVDVKDPDGYAKNGSYSTHSCSFRRAILSPRRQCRVLGRELETATISRRRVPICRESQGMVGFKRVSTGQTSAA